MALVSTINVPLPVGIKLPSTGPCTRLEMPLAVLVELLERGSEFLWDKMRSNPSASIFQPPCKTSATFRLRYLSPPCRTFLQSPSPSSSPPCKTFAIFHSRRKTFSLIHTRPREDDKTHRYPSSPSGKSQSRQDHAFSRWRTSLVWLNGGETGLHSQVWVLTPLGSSVRWKVFNLAGYGLPLVRMKKTYPVFELWYVCRYHPAVQQADHPYSPGDKLPDYPEPIHSPRMPKSTIHDAIEQIPHRCPDREGGRGGGAKVECSAVR